ncbi:uroporphyrinogen-III C-methyltransferase [Alicyclobacillus sp.]|uniref:uroporphyrinogen-III C-methyltransferase n=1 Tax=Alicyclobacillus sp. TaxID=61169 RepID=UPI0025B82220|nr:uroporphyrinogen-III C-methyltransferase [Alicyclobacillus sp.]MCL6515324.1 uroporphyrinogen-III C-methyltransferase [Alicyclobacillus sp.]
MSGAGLGQRRVGRVFLVGAGPGDAGLLTLSGRRALAQADAVVLDHLAPARLLRYAPPHAQVYDVGKEAGHHRVPQREIEALLIRLARAGMTVVRLKGGDPFVLGRGAEEAQALEAAGVPWQVVPGVTSAVAVPAYAGIPVTWRGRATGFTVVTGHSCEVSSGVDWDALARTGGTLIILMGMSALSGIVERLLVAGRAPETPAAAIRWGTRADQRTVRARLAELPDAVRRAGLTNPAVVVIGEAAEGPALDWFVRLPLFGRRVAVIGETEDAAIAAAEALEAEGAEAVALSLEWDARPLTDEAAAWVADAAGITAGSGPSDAGEPVVWWFRTALGVRAVWQALDAAGLDARALARVRLVAQGRAAADALARCGMRPDVVVGDPGLRVGTCADEGEAMLASLGGEARAIWMEAFDACPQPPFGRAGRERESEGAGAPGTGIRRTPLWRADAAALRLRFERMAEGRGVDLVWAMTPAATAVGREAASTWMDAKTVPVWVGDAPPWGADGIPGDMAEVSGYRSQPVGVRHASPERVERAPRLDVAVEAVR